MNDNFDNKYSKPISNDFEGQKYFIDKLEYDYIKFIKRWNIEYKKYYKVFKNNINDRPNIIRLRKSTINIVKICNHNYNKNKSSNFIHINIVPEKVITKSPLTILNGTWGSGKTHFLNDLLVSIKKEKIKPNIIKKYVYIDSWKYLSSNNLVNDFIVELGQNLATNVGIKFFNTRKIIKNIFNYVVIPNINKKLSLAIPKLNKDNSISIINRNITSPTLIIIDNIERLGHSAWEIIRVIQKLSISTNLIFLLSINKDKFNELCGLNNEGYEWNLEKYISIPFYNLKPNYKDLISSYNIPIKYNDAINKILTTPDGSKFLSVREAEKILQLCDFNKDNKSNENNISSKYHLLSIIKNWWNPLTKERINNSNENEEIIFKIISMDISNFYNQYILKLLKINNKYCNHINDSNYIEFNWMHHTYINPEYRFLSKTFKSYINKFIDNLNNLKKSTPISFEIDKDIKEIQNVLNLINSDSDLTEINNVSNEVYEEYFNSEYYQKSKDMTRYNSNYLIDIIKYLSNK